MRPFYVFASCLLPDRHLILQERVVTTFLTQRRQRTMAGNKGHVIAQRQQLIPNGRNQLSMVAAWKIAAPPPPPLKITSPEMSNREASSKKTT